MKNNAKYGFAALVCMGLTLGCSAGGEDELSSPPAEPAIAGFDEMQEDGWVEIAKGVWELAGEDGLERRYVGAEGHAWFMEDLRQRLETEQDPAQIDYYLELLAGLEADAGTLPSVDEMRDFKAKSCNARITSKWVGTKGGYRAEAGASRGGLGEVCARAWVRINGVVDDTGLVSKWGWNRSVAAVAQAVDYTPTSCYAYAMGAAGSCSVERESYTCPTPPVCGDGTCGGPESCSSCPVDCGSCNICGDGVCSGSESCTSCSYDCGTCSGNCVQAGADKAPGASSNLVEYCP